MYVLTEEQLEKICLELVKKSKQIYPFLYSYLIVYYELGLRFNELRYDNLYLINESTLVVRALKRSNDRYYNIADLPEPLKTFAQNNNFNAYNINYRTFLIYFNRLLGGYQYEVKKKNICTHLFRHNLAKKTFAKSKSINDVAAKLGERSNSSALGYVYSQIQCKIPMK